MTPPFVDLMISEMQLHASEKLLHMRACMLSNDGVSGLALINNRALSGTIYDESSRSHYD